MLEVYIEDMFIKYKEKEYHMTHMESIFREVRKYGAQLNPDKCNL